jgi:Tol biopolymer transport system component
VLSPAISPAARWAALWGAALGLSPWLVATAEATLPGRNGSIALGLETGRCDPNVDDDPCPGTFFQVVAVNPRTGTRTALDVCLAPTSCEDRWPNWSADGRWLSFSRPNADGSIRTVISRSRGRGARDVVSRGGRAAWSPDGRQLVFERSDGDATRLFVIGADGGGLRQLTFGESYAPDWSSGGRIVFHGRGDIYSIGADGTGLRRLTRTQDQITVQFASWSPDGRRIAFMHGQPPERELPPSVYTMRADGSRKRRLVKHGLWPTWSPDGRWIAFTRRQSIYVIHPDGSGLRRVRHMAGAIEDLAWQPRPGG